MTASDRQPPAPPARPATRTRRGSREAQARKFAIDMARLCHDRHCEQILLLDLTGRSDLTDYLLIATGTSDRQIRAVGGEIGDVAQAQHGFPRFGSELDGSATWLVLDFVDVVVHLFEPETRAHYDLEMLWEDAPKVRWPRRAPRAKSAGQSR